MPVRIRRPHSLVRISALLVLLASLPAAAGGQIAREFTFEAESLLVADMIGAVTVVPAPGDKFTVTVRGGGQDAQEGRLEFVTREGNEASLAIKFPTQDQQDYVYPPLGPSARTTISYNEKQAENGSWVKKVLGEITGRRITVRGKGKGLALWADVTVAVPRGRGLTVELGVGEVRAADLQADLALEVDSGPVEARDVQGDVRIDTGSGEVEATRMRGSLTIDTGSGGVQVRAAHGERINVDTGSGEVLAEDLDCRDLVIDTGSGGVTVRGAGADKARFDTGSGEVEVELDRMGNGTFIIDTGSGDIHLRIPRDASARITAETGSGGVSHDLQGVEVSLQDGHELDLTVGDGQASVTLGAGSGSISVTRK